MADLNQITILLFEADQCALAEKELAVLKRWLIDLRSQSKSAKITIGGASETPRTGRLRRLHTILNVLSEMGIPPRSIQPEEDWFKPTRMGVIEALPEDLAWIGVVDSFTVGSVKPK